MLTFPCWWIEDGRCACPDAAECKSPGKHPLVRSWNTEATDDADQIAAWRARYPLAHWGIATGAGAGVIVVDLDRKPGKDGLASLKALAAAHTPLPRTRTVRTGSGGLHLYFVHPGGYVPNSAGKLGAGIDTRGDGGFVIAPGSGHASGGRYELVIDTDVAYAPEWLLQLLGRSADRPAVAPEDRGYFPAASPEVLAAAQEALALHGPAIEGNGGDLHTFRAAALLVHDFALTDEEAWPLLVEWNSQCQPPWDESDLRAKLHGGGKYGRAEFGCRRTMDVVETARKIINDWRDAPGQDPASSMLAMIDRVRPLAERSGDVTKHAMIERELVAATGFGPRKLGLPRPAPARRVVAEGADSLRLDLTTTGAPQPNMNNVVRVLEFERRPIFHDEFSGTTRTGPENREWTDADDNEFALYLQRQVGIARVTPQIVSQGVLAYARRNARDLVREAVESIGWDGEQRLARFFVDAFGSDDSEYTRQAAINFWRSMVARILRPGCKVDTIVVLEGAQGIRKSSALREIAGPGLFAEASESPLSKDFFLCLVGKLLVEIAEMDALSRAEVATVKRVLSCAVDRYRAPYERTARDWPRRGVFVGTTNRNDWARDDTGARRFWPIRCTRVDLDLIKAQREQLFAEAVADVQAGATWWEMPARATEAEQEARRQLDPWEEILASHLGPDAQVTIPDLLSHPLSVDRARMGKPEQMRVASILARLGFERVDGWRDGRKQKFWRRREVGSAQAAGSVGLLPTFPPSHVSNT